MGSKGEATLLIRIKQAGGEILEHFVFTLNDVMNVLGEIPKFLMECVDKYREQELAVNELTQAMMNQGTFTGQLRNEYLEMAEALQKVTTFDNDAIVSAQATLQSMIGNRKVTEDLVKATMDLATAKKMDLNSAAQLVGKAINSETDILKRQGYEVQNVTDEHNRMGNVIKAIESKSRDLAMTQAQGLGVLAQLKNSWEDFMKAIGNLMAPFVTALAHGAKAALDFFTSIMPKSTDYSKQSIDELNQSIVKLRARIMELQERGKITGMVDDSMMKSLEAQMAKAKEAREKMLADEAAAAEQSKKIQEDKAARYTELEAQRVMKKQDMLILEEQMEGMSEEQRTAAKVRMIDQQIAVEQDGVRKKQLILQRGDLIESQRQAIANKNKLQTESLFQTQRADMISAASDFIAAVGDKESKAVFLIQKAAALATTWISTQVAAAQALATVPYPASLAAAANIETIGYIKMATIAATAIKGLATGGIVSAQPGGTPFILGEGGKDEAVIPLDDPDAQSRLGGGMKVIFQGPILGNHEVPEEIARAIDRSLLKLRQSNQSVAFESDVF